MRQKAFTLIELLVVIAIIAILAAILFPVFAQAKAAAKKTAELSSVKQVGTAFAVYTADYDDVYPLAYAVSGNQTWYVNALIEVPADWRPGFTADYYGENQVQWANSTAPYIKNSEMLKSVVGKERVIGGVNYTTAAKPFQITNFQMNGTLNGYPTTAVNSPSQLPMVSQVRGNMNIKGFSTASPILICNQPGPCRFLSSSASCNGNTTNGAWSEILINSQFTHWMHNRGTVQTFADTSAKWRNMWATPGQRSDYKTNWWTRYNADGSSITEWQDTNFCHTLLFQPDFDYATWGTPIEY